MDGMIQAHFIHEDKGLILRRLIISVPRVGDEVRAGGENNESYYKVTRVVWVYDESGAPYGRVNIGVKDGE